jgi:hypothetical protein
MAQGGGAECSSWKSAGNPDRLEKSKLGSAKRKSATISTALTETLEYDSSEMQVILPSETECGAAGPGLLHSLGS